ncbi:toxin-antitoxin locus protein VapB2 [Haemophilus influenzae]|uniref:Toxin-antitoxin locus protein VapB2 n=1 Tax=Haemophilus influenzae TaxID=727 RepID=A0A2X1QPP0_HAEIF|nr:toxin-antitoxin locus protein VapB2 [Haemophilus influenzae]
MIEASVFMTNRSQAVRLPAEVRFSEEIKKLSVRVSAVIGFYRLSTNLGIVFS